MPRIKPQEFQQNSQRFQVKGDSSDSLFRFWRNDSVKRSLQILTLLSSCVLIGCGQGIERSDRRQTKGASLDAVPAAPVTFTFALPDRKQLRLENGAIDSLITGYYYRIQGEGKNCPAEEVHEKAGPYDDGMLINVTVISSCNYLITIELGEYLGESPTIGLKATKINFQDQIQALLSERCASCHPSYTDYAAASAAGRAIVLATESESMPPNAPLPGSEIAMLLSWADHGYLEKDPAAELSPVAQTLGRVFYRNNNNDYLQNYELFGRSNYELRRSLWLQAAGQSAGIRTSQLYTFLAE